MFNIICKQAAKARDTARSTIGALLNANEYARVLKIYLYLSIVIQIKTILS